MQYLMICVCICTGDGLYKVLLLVPEICTWWYVCVLILRIRIEVSLSFKSSNLLEHMREKSSMCSGANKNGSEMWSCSSGNKKELLCVQEMYWAGWSWNQWWDQKRAFLFILVNTIACEIMFCSFPKVWDMMKVGRHDKILGFNNNIFHKVKD